MSRLLGILLTFWGVLSSFCTQASAEEFQGKVHLANGSSHRLEGETCSFNITQHSEDEAELHFTVGKVIDQTVSVKKGDLIALEHLWYDWAYTPPETSVPGTGILRQYRLLVYLGDGRARVRATLDEYIPNTFYSSQIFSFNCDTAD